MFRSILVALFLVCYICVEGSAIKSRFSRQSSCAVGTIGASGGTIRSCSGNAECGAGFTCNGAVAGKKNSGVCCGDSATVCNLAQDPGTPCTGAVNRWYFDKRAKKCRTFSYFGCGGNPNNFITEDACKAFCPGR